jgi:hypothetical protein
VAGLRHGAIGLPSRHVAFAAGTERDTEADNDKKHGSALGVLRLMVWLGM